MKQNEVFTESWCSTSETINSEIDGSIQGDIYGDWGVTVEAPFTPPAVTDPNCSAGEDWIYWFNCGGGSLCSWFDDLNIVVDSARHKIIVTGYPDGSGSKSVSTTLRATLPDGTTTQF